MSSQSLRGDRGVRCGGATWRAAGVLPLLLLLACTVPEDSARPSGITALPIVTDQSTTSTTSRPGSTPTTIQRSPCVEYAFNDDLPLRRCDEGDLVRSVQAELATVLEIELTADGFFGDQTEAAVLRYQEANGLEVDGLVGPVTWNELFGSVLPDDGSTRGISENWYARPADEAVVALEDQGFLVIDYEVCSSSVGADEVRQIAAGDGTIYLDESGVTEKGAVLPIGSVIEVKFGSGQAC